MNDSRGGIRAWALRWAWGWALAAILPAVALMLACGAVDARAGPPSWPALFWFVLAAPVLEETLFRGGLQEALLRWRPDALGPFSLANGLASIAFAGTHALYHPLGWAAAMIAPSLMFGWFYEHGRALWRPVLLHAIYNAVFLALLASP